MSECPDSKELREYLAGLSRRADEIKAHLRGCPDCTATLNRLSALSERDADRNRKDSPPGELSGDALERLLETIWKSLDEGGFTEDLPEDIDRVPVL